MKVDVDALRPVDDATMDVIRGVNEKAYGSLRLVRGVDDPDGSRGYFANHAKFDRPGDFAKMVRSFNLGDGASEIRVCVRMNSPIGNEFIMFRDAIEFCSRHGIDKLYLEHGGEYYKGNYFDFTDSWVETTTLDALDIPEHVALLVFDGFFFLYYGIFHKRNGRHYTQQYSSATDDLLAKAFTLSSDEPYPLSTLVVHIRSGDTLQPHVIHHDTTYLQPPLIWYKKCIMAHRRHFPDTSVILIFWDRKNPCADALGAWCRNEGIPLTEHSAATSGAHRDGIAEDYAHMMKARSFIDSRGSFTEMVRKLNRNLKIFYRFETRYFAGGPYDKTGDWSYTPEIRNQMLEILEEDLFLQRDLYHSAFCVHRYRTGYIPFWKFPIRMAAAWLARKASVFFPGPPWKRRLMDPLYERILSSVEESMIK